MRILLFLAMILASFCAAFATAAESDNPVVEIPLEEIWAYQMLGANNVHDLELGPVDSEEFAGWSIEEFVVMRETAIADMELALLRKAPSEPAAPGFVIPRKPSTTTLRDTAQRLSAAISGRQVSLEPLNDEADATLVFFSHPSSYYVRLTKVERDDSEITVKYQFVPHKTSECTVHFAFIPLGKLPAGEYQVRFEQAPLDQKFHDEGFTKPSLEQVQRTICDSFAFTVDKSISDPVDESGEEIALDTIWALSMPGTRDVRELDPRVAAEETMITRMGRGLFAPETRHPKAGPCFVVKGEGREALTNAVRVLVEGEKPLEFVPAGEDVSLIFYAHPAPGYVYLQSVRRSSEHLTLNYYVMLHQTANATVHFALIPLGKLDPGKFTVDIVKVGSGGSRYDPKQAERAVCDPCSFVVRDRGTPQ